MNTRLDPSLCHSEGADFAPCVRRRSLPAVAVCLLASLVPPVGLRAQSGHKAEFLEALLAEPSTYRFEVAGDAGIHGMLDMGASGANQWIVRLADPIDNQDAATKAYVDGQVGGAGDITAVAAGPGLTGGGEAGPVTLSADASYLQRRVSGACDAGSSIRVINSNGSVGCETDSNSGGDITGVIAGTGLSGGGTEGEVTLNLDVHDHLGQSWVGADNPLELSGSYAGPKYAPLVLSNSYGLGHGLVIETTGLSGVSIDSAGEDGVYVHAAGTVSATTQSGEPNGFEVAGAAGNGLFVGQAGIHGVEVNGANGDGLRVTNAGDDGIQIGDGTNFPLYGMFVPEPGTAGTSLIVNTANSLGEWALVTPDKISAGNVTTASYTLLAVVAQGQALASGDLVAAVGMTDSRPESLRPIPQVGLASTESPAVLGVVESRMVWKPYPGKEGAEGLLGSVDGPARPGDYVALTVLGLAKVRVDPNSRIDPGQRLAPSNVSGQARALRSVDLEGVRLAEDAPTVGVALAEVDGEKGLIWMLVNVR